MMCFVGFVPLLTSIDHSSKCRTQRAEVTNEGKMDLVEMDSPRQKDQRPLTTNGKISILLTTEVICFRGDMFVVYTPVISLMSFLPKRFMMVNILRFQLAGKVLIARRTRVWSIVEVISIDSFAVAKSCKRWPD